ncbi:MAG: cupin domain-containing protein [Paenisporosarcina sp.]
MIANSLYYFKDDGIIPNNPKLPVIFYKGEFESNPDQIEAIFNQHNWQNSWVNGVFPYHHYHSNSHEALGVRSGSARLKLGGEQGEEVSVDTGDVLILPAGTGHMKIISSPDFKIVGAYPDGMDYNLKTGKAGERPQVLNEIQQVPTPDQDPVFGKKGALFENW